MEQTTNSHSKKTELGTLIIIFILILTLFKIVFYEEKITTVIQTTAAFFWLLVIPGYFLTKVWKEQSIIEKFVISIPISAALLGITSYYLALWGLSLYIQSFILPPIIISFSILLNKLFKQTT